MHPTVFLQNVASNGIAHGENVIISKLRIKSFYLRNHLQKFLKFIRNHIKSCSSHLVSVNFGLIYQNTKTLCRMLYRKSYMFLLVSALLFPLLLKSMFAFLPRLLTFKLFFHISYFNYFKWQIRVKANENSAISLKIWIFI